MHILVCAVYICSCASVHACEGQRLTSGVFFYLLLPYALVQGLSLLTELDIDDLDRRVVSEPLRSAYLCVSSTYSHNPVSGFA